MEGGCDPQPKGLDGADVAGGPRLRQTGSHEAGRGALFKLSAL